MSDIHGAADVLVPLMARVDGSVLDAVADLRLVQQWGAGLEGVDTAAASARGIAVGNVPSTVSGSADSVAEWCVLAALALSRRLRAVEAAIRSGDSWGGPIGRSLVGRTAGIVGVGGIGTALAKRLVPFGMEVIGVTRRPDPSRAEAAGLTWLGTLDDLVELLRRSDFVFLCLPLTSETTRLIDAAALDEMQHSACLVNPGRGGLIDEDALVRALDAGHLQAAGLDVFTSEPIPLEHPFLDHADVLATPHIGGITDSAYERIATFVTDAFRRLAAGQPLAHCVNWTAVRDDFYSRA
jgi:phosphoglycerate dehydrogenase-like enzyme